MTGNISTRAEGTDGAAGSEPKSPTPMGGTSVSEVLARLEAAECGSRELDAEVASALEDGEVVWIQNRYIEGSNPAIRRPSANHLGGFVNDPCYSVTTSLDAALALAERVLPTHDWSVGHLPVSDDSDFEDHWSFGCLFYAHPHVSSRQDVQGWGATAALAICGAILRARQASSSPTPVDGVRT